MWNLLANSFYASEYRSICIFRPNAQKRPLSETFCWNALWHWLFATFGFRSILSQAKSFVTKNCKKRGRNRLWHWLLATTSFMAHFEAAMWISPNGHFRHRRSKRGARGLSPPSRSKAPLRKFWKNSIFYIGSLKKLIWLVQSSHKFQLSHICKSVSKTQNCNKIRQLCGFVRNLVTMPISGNLAEFQKNCNLFFKVTTYIRFLDISSHFWAFWPIFTKFCLFWSMSP